VSTTTTVSRKCDVAITKRIKVQKDKNNSVIESNLNKKLAKSSWGTNVLNLQSIA